MLNFFFKDEKLLKFKIFNFVGTFNSCLYYNDLLILKNPKLINFISKRFSDSLETLNVNEIVSDDLNSIHNNSSKFEKKQRNSLYGQNSKKLKSKPVKNRIKNSISIEDVDVNLLDNTSNNLFNQDLLSRSSNKSRKVNQKNKKQHKEKLQVSDTENLGNSFNESEKFLDGVKLDDSIKVINLTKNLTIQELSKQMNIPEAEIITYLFLDKGISATINELLDVSTIRNIAENYSYTVSEAKLEQSLISCKSELIKDSLSNVSRSPVITILGHVDHGKTTLLDKILKTNLVDKEQGGITQSISGYEITWNYSSKNYSLIFLDTPGHESFQEMRLRGAKVTDIILLVIAMDDGLKPQTIEAINYIKQMSLLCIVVITKCDKLSNNLEKIQQELSSHGILCEQWGGDVPLVEVSAFSGYNIDLLLSQICLFSERNNFLADPNVLAAGTILEAYLDKKQGPIASLIVQNGTLNVGDIIISQNVYGRVKSIINTSSRKIRSSGPSSLVKVLAFNGIPQVGSPFSVFTNEKDAKKFCLEYSNTNKLENVLKSLDTRIALDTLSDVKQLRIILKVNTYGSLEAILSLLNSISQSKVQINIIHASCGDISNSDIELAIATSSIIIGFDVNLLHKIRRLLKQHKITFSLFRVIYDLFDYVKGIMFDLIQPEYDKVLIGQASVKTVFNMNQGCVAGCIVTDGKLTIESYINVYRNNIIVYEGFISSLKQVKNDIQEVNKPHECGLMADFDLWQNNDVIKVYSLVFKEKTL